MTIIRVEHTHQTILSIAPNGMFYQLPNGQTAFINFKACYNRYLKMHPIFLQYPNVKKIGERDSTRNLVELATDPITRFEFDNHDEWGYFLHRLRRCGWLTFDLS